MEPLVDEATLASRVRALGAELRARHGEAEIVLVGVLKGAFVFLADLARAIPGPVRVEFLGVRSYGAGTTSSGTVEFTKDLDAPIDGAHVVLVEDIVDTGLTARAVLDRLAARGPARLELAALLHKPARTVVSVPIDYLGFTIDDVFVVGYGLDAAERHRNLPYLTTLETT